MIFRFLIFTSFAGTVLAADPAAGSPWSQNRGLEQFSGLLKRSPFSLPTTEESAPLVQRFTLTGAITLDGESQIFVLDKTTLKRERVGASAGPSGLQLVELLSDPDPRKMRATIRLGDQTATIAYVASAAPAAAPTVAATESAGGKPATPIPASPSAQVLPPAAGEDAAKKPGRIVIRRPKISANPTPVQ